MDYDYYKNVHHTRVCDHIVYYIYNDDLICCFLYLTEIPNMLAYRTSVFDDAPCSLLKISNNTLMYSHNWNRNDMKEFDVGKEEILHAVLRLSAQIEEDLLG